jgi:1-deoxy-D-xylulose-5-phosphate synthase
MTPVDRVGGIDVLARPRAGGPHGGDVLLVSVGGFAPLALDVAHGAADQGIEVTVVDPRWVKPLDPALVDLARNHRLVVTLEDNGRTGGVGAQVSQLLRDADVDVPVRNVGIPQEFLHAGTRGEVLTDIGLSVREITRRLVEALARLEPVDDTVDSMRTDAVRTDTVRTDTVQLPADPPPSHGPTAQEQTAPSPTD